MLTSLPLKTEAEVLLVDDSPADIDLAREALSTCKHRFHVSSVNDGVQAISFLHREGTTPRRRFRISWYWT